MYVFDVQQGKVVEFNNPLTLEKLRARNKFPFVRIILSTHGVTPSPEEFSGKEWGDLDEEEDEIDNTFERDENN